MYINLNERAHTITETCRVLIFPDYFCDAATGLETFRQKLVEVLRDTVDCCFAMQGCSGDADAIVKGFVDGLPHLAQLIQKDVQATYNGDPAAESVQEVVLCYPGTRAIGYYRIAHFLLESGVPLLPRIITELAHSETGIDINPGAQIGESFAIDHGTGIVIGATAIIGNNVKIYQGVTLGARSFPLDADGNPVKRIPRHPILEDNVIVYANATILGRVTIGHDAVIGGNIWVTEDVPAGARVVQSPKKYF